MPPTKIVPAALHSELTEYASLLRAIRTSSTLDIVPQLSRSIPQLEASDNASDDDTDFDHEDDGESSSHRPSPELPKESIETVTLSKGKSKAKSPSKSVKKFRRKNDGWTRWPLLQEHCPVPEWSFDEEIVAIAEQSIRTQTRSSHSSPSSTLHPDRSENTNGNEDPDDDIADELILSKAQLLGITSEAASKLSSTLALLAFHRPHTTFTKHGRIAPMNWQDVLDAVGISRIFDTETVDGVKRRLEAIYGVSESHIIDRMHVLEASNRALAEAEASLIYDFSTQGAPLRRKKRKSKQGPAIDAPSGSQVTGSQEHVADEEFDAAS
ncbi:hypothetical protein K439DRAFT_1637436 [Ramaria rubella]|nr:hypothetical protein K439DRAFT_1637436 [Ramaria rubella]